eukprot:TRINITY_DN35515_c0_g1_i1.p5 TRINITY_DN35515_c0_g1~~TRINITY_DN35515_c0_g1_i1.p5  ORF type:complete len:109 (-),score=18.72 TRINITY_DN35515_c0_g1_i1:790-1116(-)
MAPTTKASGGRKKGVPTVRLVVSSSALKRMLTPKSTNTTRPVSGSSSTLSGLMSLWTTPTECMCATASTIWAKALRAFGSAQGCSFMYPSYETVQMGDPPTSSVTKKT